MGADTYFLDGATRMLEEFLKSAQPPAEARIEFAAGKRHGWEPQETGRSGFARWRRPSRASPESPFER